MMAFDNYLVEPAREFVTTMGECLKPLGSDIRFARDKTPYETYLDLWFWQGAGPGRERPGYFFRLTPESLTLGAGMHGFSDAVLERYRQAVVDPVKGEDLEAVAQTLNNHGLEIDGQTYKKVPQGLPADHPRAKWLRHGGLFAAAEQPTTEAVFTGDLPNMCVTQFKRVAPLQQWLVDLLAD
jgi:uncharacterized protein (TIGR02453 family)